MTSSRAGKGDIPAFLQFLDRQLKLPLRAGRGEVLAFDVYRMDLSSWRLRFSDHTPVLYVSETDARSMTPRELFQSLRDVVYTRGYEEQNPIVLMDGDGTELREEVRTHLVTAIVLDQADQARVLASRRPSAELLDCISPQLSLSLMAPYETSKPVTGSRFFGREFDIRKILYARDANFAVMGIRRIGKTSLLREIERRLGEQAEGPESNLARERILFMDCSAIRTPEHFVQEVVRQLAPRELVRLQHRQFPLYFPDFLARMARHYKGSIFFLLDEFDALLKVPFGQSYLLDQLRAASNSGHCRFVIAGFREVLNAFSDQNSPLYNFANPLRLKEFSRDETNNLILAPMESLGVHFERRNEVVDRIYDETGGQPNLIQHYCAILVEKMDRRQERVISIDDLATVYEDEDFRAFVLNTFNDNTSHLEKALVYIVLLDASAQSQAAAEARFTLEEMDNALQERGIDVLLSDLEGSCRQLELAGIFAKQGVHYHFATPVFPDVLRRGYNIEYLLRKVREEGIW